MIHNIFISSKFLIERKRQTAVALLGVAIGVSAFIVMTSLMRGFQKYFIKQALNINGHINLKVEENNDELRIVKKAFNPEKYLFVVLGSKPKEKKYKISNYKQIIKMYSSNPEIIGISPHLLGTGMVVYGTKEKNASLIGIYPELENKTVSFKEYLKSGKLSQLEADKNNIIIGIKLADDLGIKEPGKKISIVSPSGNIYTLKVIDFLNTGITEIDKTRIYIHIKKLQTILEKPGQVNEIIFKIKHPEDAVSVAKQISLQTGYKAESWQEAFRNFLSLFRMQNYITYIIVFSILVVSAFGIFNIIMMTVLEKKKDIAILKAIGYSNIDIIFIFTIQGLIIGIIGGIIGNILGFYILEWLETVKIEVEGIIRVKGFILDRNILYHLFGFIFAFVFSLLAAFYPSYRASKLYPVDIFRTGG